MAELDARFAAKRAHGKGLTDASAVAAAAGVDIPDAINLADEGHQKAAHGRGRKRSVPTGDGRGTSTLTSRKRGVPDTISKRDAREGAVPRRRLAVCDGERRPVIVLLGGEQWELNRAKLLCKKFEQRRLYTSLVWGATHVVVGSGLTLERSSGINNGSGSGKGGGSSGVVDEENVRNVGHELVKHGVEGYLEAVMLGLWVLDFSWVEACLEAVKGTDSNTKSKPSDSTGVNRRSVSSPQASPRQFELVGCLKNHPGCEPRRGRVARGEGFPGVFSNFIFYFTGAGSSEIEKDRLARLVELGEGTLKRNSKPKATGGRGGWTDDPFAGAGGSSDYDKGGSDVDAGGVSDVVCDRARTAPAVKGKEVVLVVMSDCPDGTISEELAASATKESVKIGATASVDQAWIIRSVEEGSQVPFDDHRLSRFLDILPARKSVLKDGSCSTATSLKASDERSGRSSKRRLSIPRGSSRQREVVLDVGEERHRRNLLPVDKLMLDAKEAIETADRVTKQAAALRPPALGAEGFQFTRLGGRKTVGRLLFREGGRVCPCSLGLVFAAGRTSSRSSRS